ncbi:MAG: fimbria/pilus periplasmic chaperone [Oceanicaulis sp.]
MRLKSIIAALSAALVIAFSAASVRAYEVEPLIFDLAPFGRAASQTILVNNTQQVPIVFEVVAERRFIDEFGEETREDAVDDFLIIPPQARVEPGESQQIRVRYIGRPDITESQHYALTVRQVPLEELQESGVQVLVNFAASVQVVPPRAAAALQVASAEISADEDGTPVARFRLENLGNRYQGLARSTITLASGGQEMVLEGESLNRALRHTLVPGGGARWGYVELPDGWPTSGPLDVRVDLP